jgi:hypothetical protein
VKQEKLSIGDVAVALAMATEPKSPLRRLSEVTCRSIGEVHNAERRLRLSRLLRPGSRSVEREPLFQFIRWGVPHAYPPATGPLTRGVVTARILEEGAGVPEEAEFVWPHPDGLTRGQAFAPPYPRAPRLAIANPALHRLLALLDLVRIGGVREQAMAVSELERLTRQSPS